MHGTELGRYGTPNFIKELQKQMLEVPVKEPGAEHVPGFLLIIPYSFVCMLGWR
jgi:hypothetical protein